MQVRVRRALVITAVLVALTSCSGSDKDAPPPPSAALVAACDGMAEALCGRAATCAPFLFQGAYGDAQSCLSFGRSFCSQWLPLPGVTRDVSVLKRCADAWVTADCDRFPSLPPAECDLRGSLGDGDGCSDGGQCASGFCTAGGDACGMCAARATEGQGCVSEDHCDRGLTCLGGYCFRAGAQGADCAIMGYDACLPALHCVKHSCGVPLAEGAACEVAGDPKECDVRKGHLCVKGKCTATVLPLVGAPCNDELCAFGAYCDGKVCQRAKAVGAACSGSQECQLGLGCDSGACQPAPVACDP